MIKKEGTAADLTPEQAAALVADQARKQERYDWKVMAQFLMDAHGGVELSCIRPFRAAVDAWRVMRNVVVGVEIGTGGSDGIRYDFTRNPEHQVVSLPFAPGPLCRMLDSPLPLDPYAHPVTGKPMEVNLDRVHVYRLQVRRLASSVPVHQGARLNFLHNGKPKEAAQEAYALSAAAAGCVMGEFLNVPPETPPEGIDVLDGTAISRQDYGVINENFIATMALVRESNLLNGIIPVPPDVCVRAGFDLGHAALLKRMPDPQDAELEAAFSKITISSDEQRVAMSESVREQVRTKREQAIKDTPPVTCYMAVPSNHVLAWWMCSQDYAKSKGANERFEPFSFTPQPDNPGRLPVASYTPYFFVDDVCFRSMLAEFRAILNRNVIDSRPLSSIAIELVPKLGDRARYYPHLEAQKVERVAGSTTLLAYVSYVVEPKLSDRQIASLAPTLHPDLHPSGDYVPDQVVQQMIEDAVQAKLRE